MTGVDKIGVDGSSCNVLSEGLKVVDSDVCDCSVATEALAVRPVISDCEAEAFCKRCVVLETVFRNTLDSPLWGTCEIVIGTDAVALVLISLSELAGTVVGCGVVRNVVEAAEI